MRTSTIAPEVAVARARKAALRRHHPDTDTTEADRSLAAAKLADYIKRTVAAAPPLSGEQRDQLAVLLRGSVA